MADEPTPSLRDILLTRRGLAFLPSGTPASGTKSGGAADPVCAVELELAQLGYVPSARLRARISTRSIDELSAFRAASIAAILRHLGGDPKHEPLFRRFPEGVPQDTAELWWKKVLVHFLQAEGQPCLFCGRSGTTHVLNPCRHVVCDQCFDGSNYSACPSCEHQVDRSSPFFQPAPRRGPPAEKVVFKLLDLGEDEVQEVRRLFVSLCERKQALSPDDRQALTVLLREYKSRVLPWLPEKIPVRENVAIVFGTLFQECGPGEVLPVARRYMTTATDVLRFIAVLSGTDGSLLRETLFKVVDRTEPPSRFWSQVAKWIGAPAPGPQHSKVTIPIRVCRFKVAKMSRPLRRALLSLLDGMDRDRLLEDMLRHRSYWVWVGEFLHPHEHAARFPNVAAAFQVVRKKTSEGTPAPRFRGWHSRLEQHVLEKSVDKLLEVLNERPGEFARRFDFALRSVRGDDAAIDRVVQSFVQLVPALATPVLLTLSCHLPRRVERASVRVYWPKGRIAKGVSAPDQRTVLSLRAIEPAVAAITGELLERFSRKPAFAQAVVDQELRNVTAPFNERTASRSAVSLPRGSRIRVPLEKTVRLFLHWCEPATAGQRTDLDLSVALYDDAWKHVGVCSYYQLQLKSKHGPVIARSSGDLQNAPWPDGATEFVDLDSEQALASGARYAVMVVNAFAGMPFSRLERGNAGLMLRGDTGGQHFDPRTVELQFALDGENGVFMPLVLDLREKMLHWLDVQSKGQFAMNNVENSNSAIAKICPELMAYFGSGVRPSMYELALYHAAARCERVIVRGSESRLFERKSGEDIAAFHKRLLAGDSGEPVASVNGDTSPALAVLFRGDLELPEGSSIYALFRERLIPSLAASDLLS